jgi:serine/threonine protein kinase
MDTGRYERVKQLFELCRGLPQAERDIQLFSEAAGDPEVNREVRTLLDAYDRSQDFLEQPVLAHQAEILERAIRPSAELSKGTRFGHYEIVALLGKGGMGVVYRARDTRLGRDVALKILPTALADDPLWRARFQIEARALAALNHPNIAAIYDQEDNALVMELVLGPTLHERILSGPIPLEEIQAIARQIAEALEVAHERGIVHRDLKPGNIKLTPDGAVKLLDFGLAKATEAGSIDGISGPHRLLSLAPMESGVLLGTAGYMSPEQVAGKVVDKRTDIWAFGVVLFEMLTRKRLFEGESVNHTLANVLSAEIDLATLPPTTPPLFRALLRRCLERDVKKRLRDIGEARILLDSSSIAGGSLIGQAPLIVEGYPISEKFKPKPVSFLFAWTVAAVAVLALLLGALYLRRANASPPELRTDIVTPPTDDQSSFSLSPDGKLIAFAASDEGTMRLWVRPLDSTSAQVLPGTEGARSPFWSPDSRSLGFFADFKLKRIDLGGAQPAVLATVPSNFAQGTWGKGGVILFSWGVTPISRVPAGGGEVSVATRLAKGQNNQFAPRFLPDGRKFLYVVNGTDTGIWLGSLDGTPPRRITSIDVGSDSAAEYLAPGWLVRVRQGVLEAQRFDVNLGRLSGDPVALDRSVRVAADNLAGSFSVSAAGTIAWRSGAAARRQLIWFNRSGQNLGPLGAVGDATLFSPELSRDGKRVATMRGPVGSSDIWLQEGTRIRRLTFNPFDDRYPLWSPDGKSVAFASNRNGPYDLYRKLANGSGIDELLLQSPDFKRPNAWSPDGRFILYWVGSNKGDLMVLPLNGGLPFPFVSSPFNEQQGVFSPDGKWVAYQSDESGSPEVYVRPFPGPGGEAQVSAGGGHSPRWRSDGRELYYISPDLKLMAAKVRVQGAAFTAATPASLFQTHINQATNRPQYDVARDGRFLILTDLPDTSTEPIHLLVNWKLRSP